jgi:hypothetical protein
MKKVTDMKKTNLILAILIAGMLFVSGAGICTADGYTIFTYNTALPTGEMRDFITDFSWLGFTFESKWFIRGSDRLTLGFNLSWQSFYQRAQGTWTIENVTVTGTQQRYIDAVPIMLTSNIHFGDWIRPYVGLQAGGAWVLQRLAVGINVYDESKWHWALAPNLGLLIPVGNIYLAVDSKYYYIFPASDTSSFAYWTYSAGLAFDI